MKKIICTRFTQRYAYGAGRRCLEMGARSTRNRRRCDAANGQELYVYNADEQLRLASVTKIMTMLLAM